MVLCRVTQTCWGALARTNSVSSLELKVRSPYKDFEKTPLPEGLGRSTLTPTPAPYPPPPRDLYPPPPSPSTPHPPDPHIHRLHPWRPEPEPELPGQWAEPQVVGGAGLEAAPPFGLCSQGLLDQRPLPAGSCQCLELRRQVSPSSGRESRRGEPAGTGSGRL